MIDDNLHSSLLGDLQNAEKYKENGEENKSRVIARQVAGKAIRALLEDLNITQAKTISPYQYLLISKEYPEIFSPILTEVEALTRKVNPDYSFPENLDLIHSSKKIILFVKEYKK
jgi:HEPN domain-containing protein